MRPTGDAAPETVAQFVTTMDGDNANRSLMAATAALVTLRSSTAEVLATIQRHALHKDANVGAAASFVLMGVVDSYGDDVVPELEAFFESEAQARQVAAVALAGSKHDSPAVRRLLATRKDDADEQVRKSITQALELRERANGLAPP